MKEVEYVDLGRMAYGECWEKQRSLFDRILAVKAGAEDEDITPERAGWLLLVEHDPVYTLGKSGKDKPRPVY